MNKPLKKIIAREGLIFLAFILLTYLFIAASLYSIGRYFCEPITFPAKALAIYEGHEIDIFRKAGIISRGIFGILLPYLVYLLIRFIIWAVKTLKRGRSLPAKAGNGPI